MKLKENHRILLSQVIVKQFIKRQKIPYRNAGLAVKFCYKSTASHFIGIFWHNIVIRWVFFLIKSHILFQGEIYKPFFSEVQNSFRQTWQRTFFHELDITHMCIVYGYEKLNLSILSLKMQKANSGRKVKQILVIGASVTIHHLYEHIDVKIEGRSNLYY